MMKEASAALIALMLGCSATPAPSPSSPSINAVPAPFGRVQLAKQGDLRYSTCRWRHDVYRPCTGMMAMRREVWICDECAVDADCRDGVCAATSTAGAWPLHVNRCLSSIDRCEGPDARAWITGVDDVVRCSPIELCDAQ